MTKPCPSWGPQCGFTGQYKGLQAVHDKYKDKGFSVHAFPCNQFGGQEPDAAAQIEEQMCERFKTTFPIYDKVKVKGFGDECEPLWVYLKKNSQVLMSKEIWWCVFDPALKTPPLKTH